MDNIQPTVWVKYHLSKDGSPAWDGCAGMEEAQQRIAELKQAGYTPTIDRKMSGLDKSRP